MNAALPRADRPAVALGREVAATVPAEALERLRARSGGVHLLYAARQIALLVGLGLVCLHGGPWWRWLPAALLQGFVLFGFAVLLHEVVHRVVFARDRPLAEGALGWMYGAIGGLCPSQYARWHLDHHAEVGTPADPKRAYLTPRRHARWEKLLYFTPALFPIFFRAAAVAARGYPAELRRRIARERVVVFGFQFGLAAALYAGFGWGGVLRAWVVPVFFAFPLAWGLNRIGQHYDIDPDDPAAWTTLLRPSRVWGVLFLHAQLHAEHHLLPDVPLYRLPEAHQQLAPMYRRHGIQPRSYPRLLWGWFVEHRAPHTRWE